MIYDLAPFVALAFEIGTVVTWMMKMGSLAGGVSILQSLVLGFSMISGPNGSEVREMGPLISGKSRLVNYYNLAR